MPRCNGGATLADHIMNQAAMRAPKGAPVDNPMGTDGFEFVEYTAPDPELLRTLFERLGFPVRARHRSKNVTLHRQGDINFIINAEPNSFGQQFAKAHGPSACAMAFRVKDATFAYKRALELGRETGQDGGRSDGAAHPLQSKASAAVSIYLVEWLRPAHYSTSVDFGAEGGKPIRTRGARGS